MTLFCLLSCIWFSSMSSIFFSLYVHTNTHNNIISLCVCILACFRCRYSNISIKLSKNVFHVSVVFFFLLLYILCLHFICFCTHSFSSFFLACLHVLQWCCMENFERIFFGLFKNLPFSCDSKKNKNETVLLGFFFACLCKKAQLPWMHASRSFILSI